MPLTTKRIIFALATAAFAVPAFAGDLTGFKILKPAEKPCEIRVERVAQEGYSGAVHVGLRSLLHSGTMSGRLLVNTRAGTPLGADSTDFKLPPGAYLDYIGNRNPRERVSGENVFLSFQSCVVTMP